jgi:hypothetical protein
MGMFDEIRCEVALPDRLSPEETIFQTKTFPEPCLQRYVITKAGRLIDHAGNDLEPDGYIEFYTSEPSSNPGAGKDQSVWREYRARFLVGQLQEIVSVKERPKFTHYGLAHVRWFNTPSFGFNAADD